VWLLPGSFLDQKSTLFQEEFPQLGPGGAGDGGRRTCSYSSRENDDEDVTFTETTDQYAVGPTLRPHSMRLMLLLQKKSIFLYLS